MNRRAWKGLTMAVMALAAFANLSAGTAGAAAKRWKVDELKQALASPSRPEADRMRDADRKPAELMTFFGVEKGMAALDVIGLGGYMTEVLSIAVGPSGKVYAQNGQVFLQLQNGAFARALDTRLASNRLPNVTRVDGDLPNVLVPNGRVDVAIMALNLHDVFNHGGADAATAFLKGIFTELKPGGVLGLVDHVGNDGDNTKLHRITKQQAINVAKASGFVLEAQSDMLANPLDDHTKVVFDPTIRGKTDEFILRLRKPK